jgi:hypothetical protein
MECARYMHSLTHSRVQHAAHHWQSSSINILDRSKDREDCIQFVLGSTLVADNKDARECWQVIGIAEHLLCCFAIRLVVVVVVMEGGFVVVVVIAVRERRAARRRRDGWQQVVVRFAFRLGHWLLVVVVVVRIVVVVEDRLRFG